MLTAQMDAADLQELEHYVAGVAAAVEDEMDKVLPNVEETGEARLFKAMRYSVFAGGKRIRPVLVMAANDMLSGKTPRALRVAAAMEILHTYSLIHDDLPCMDDDDLRRGKPTCHVKFDEATAVLAGDALLTMAFEILSDRQTHPDSTTRIELVGLFARSAGAQGMVGGQMIDMLAENLEEEMDQGALARLQRKKTGALFSACCEAAVVLNGASREEHHRLTTYARNIGLAFQMVDDILDITGEEETLGKRINKDARRGKATFATVLGVEGAKHQAEMLCQQAIQVIHPFGRKARMLELLARFVVSRAH